MSILIKGMEMPKDGDAVVLVISNENGKTLAEVDEYCGAVYKCVPIPPHGDLIDQDEYRDEFMNGVYALCSDDSDNYRANAIIDLFDDAPTIIPASEEGE